MLSRRDERRQRSFVRGWIPDHETAQDLYGALAEALHNRGIHDEKLTAFLPVTADLKAIADYETGGDGISRERAEAAISYTETFVEAIIAIPAAQSSRQS